MQSHQGHHCANCGQPLTGKYCAACGQPADTHKINFHYLWHDFQHGFFHFDNGVFFTVKQLFTRPGHAIRDFLEGKRVRHFKPFSLVVLLATVYVLLHHLFGIDMDNGLKVNTDEPAFDVKRITDWLNDHYAISSLILLPFLALASWLAFFKKKGGFNYLEHLVITAFLAGQRLAVGIASLPLLWAFKGTKNAELVLSVVTLVNIGLFIWTYLQLFRSPKIGILLRCLLYAFVLVFYFFLLAIVIVVLTGKAQIGASF